jgi:hypothetical protein
MAVVECPGTIDGGYHIDDKLKFRWDKIKDGKLKKLDQDRVYVVDGRERTGKSVWTLQQACYIDPTLIGDLSRICFTAEEFLEAIKKTDSTLTNTKCIIFDEAFRGLSSRAATSRVNKKILQSLMEVGQKNLVLWIVLPSFFMLDLYPAMLRSNALFHIKKEKNSNRRSFGVYSYKKKGSLYQIGVRKGWTYFPTRNIGRFSSKFPGGEAFDKAYRAKKHKALVESEINKPDKEAFDKKKLTPREKRLYELALEGKTHLEITEIMNSEGDPISPRATSLTLGKIRSKLSEIMWKDREKQEMAKKSTEKSENVVI